MFIVLSPLNPDPLYKQITDQIKDAVASGQLQPETRLPSIREMSSELNTSAITVKRAYADLESEGFILTRAGLGTFIADIDPDKLKREKISAIRKDLKKIVTSAEKYGVSLQEIQDLLRRIKE